MSLTMVNLVNFRTLKKFSTITFPFAIGWRCLLSGQRPMEPNYIIYMIKYVLVVIPSVYLYIDDRIVLCIALLRG